MSLEDFNFTKGLNKLVFIKEVDSLGFTLIKVIIEVIVMSNKLDSV